MARSRHLSSRLLAAASFADAADADALSFVVEAVADAAEVGDDVSFKCTSSSFKFKKIHTFGYFSFCFFFVVIVH